MLASPALTLSARETAEPQSASYARFSGLPARMATLLTAGAGLVISTGACAATLSVEVTDAGGQPVADAVVYAEPAGSPVPLKSSRTVEIEQKARKFMPTVTVVQTGTNISFPNNDTVRHHVYSVSTPRPFDIKLYSGQPANPIHFDKPGTVVIGCNIHDQMVAYVHAVSTPWFGKSDAAGKVRLDDLPPGRYELKAWHYAMPLTAPIAAQSISIAGNDTSAAVKLGVRAAAAVQ